MRIYNKHLVIGVLFLMLAINFLSGQDLSSFYCSPFSPTTAGIATLTNGGSYLDLWYVNSMGGLSQANSTMYTLEGDWAKSVIPETPAHEYIGYQGFYYAPFRDGSATRETRNLLVNPIFYPDAGTSPTHQKLILLEDDPVGDHLLGSAYLDIISNKVGFSESKLYFAIHNNATSFPVSSGINFFAYMCVIADPEADPETDPTVYGLMYTVDVAGVISPGLYKITGTGLSDQTKIGDIETSVDAANGTLFMSCNLSDLLADPDFASWFDPTYPVIGVVSMTSRINLTSGVQTSDQTAGGNVVLLPKHLDWQDNEPASLSDPIFTYSEGSLSFSVNYFDADGNFPSNVSWSVDGSEGSVMRPVITTGFDVPVLFIGEPISVPSGWTQATVSYTVGNQSFSQTFDNPSDTSDPLLPPASLSLYPNPVREQLSYRLSGSSASSDIRLYNLKGQLVHQAPQSSREGNIDLRGMDSGVYILQVGDTQRRILKY